MSASFLTTSTCFTSAILLRIVLFAYGLLQDKHAPLPYTDIDYYVFTDAARYVSQGYSPYLRETYRYTPLLAWLLLPTTWPGTLWFSFGKVLLAAADVIAGWLILLVLRSPSGANMPNEKALKFASIWLLNPMVATISTRGSSEALLGVMVVALLWAALTRHIKLAGMLLGSAVHFKIYPFIYGISILLYLQPPDTVASSKTSSKMTIFNLIFTWIRRHFLSLLTPTSMSFAGSSLATFTALNIAMYVQYSQPFITHTYLHHLTRIDHRHNFSPYNTLLHLSSAAQKTTGHTRFESLAFIPQLVLSAILIPLALAKKDLPGAMLAQTFAFVTFNKVCTSQYFLWYLVLVPFYLPYSSLLISPGLGIAVAILWVGTQAAWLYQAYLLEFIGQSTFVPGLFIAGLAFFAVNCWILGIIVGDVGKKSATKTNRETEDDGSKESIDAN